MASIPKSAPENNSTTANLISTRKTWLGGLSIALAIFALTGSIFTLMGFGAALALETFGLSPAAVYSSPFDYLVLSSVVLLELFSNLAKANTNSDAHDYWYLIAAPVISLIVLFAYLFLSKNGPSHVQKLVRKDSPFMRNFATAVLAQPWIKLPLVTLAAWTIGSSLLRIVLVIFIAIIIVPIIPSCMGYEAGARHLSKSVVNPLSCARLNPKKERIKPQSSSTDGPYAICLRVSKDGKELGRGRQIERTQDMVFLFKPLSGEVFSIPIKDAVVEQIEKL